MGSWGPESCSNDSCWDELRYARNIHKITQKESDKCVAEVFKTLGDKDACDIECKLGVVIWCLDHGRTVAPEYIGKAVGYAMRLLKDKDYIDGWFNEKERIDALNNEIAILTKAAANGGKGESRKVKGLMTRMHEAMAGGKV